MSHNNIPPKDDDELPKAGLELPNPVDEAAPNTGVVDSGDDDWPKTPVEVFPNIEAPVCEPKGLPAPKGFGAKGLLVGLLCPKGDWAPKDALGDCPNADRGQNKQLVK